MNRKAATNEQPVILYQFLGHRRHPHLLADASQDLEVVLFTARQKIMTSCTGESGEARLRSGDRIASAQRTTTEGKKCIAFDHCLFRPFPPKSAGWPRSPAIPP